VKTEKEVKMKTEKEVEKGLYGKSQRAWAILDTGITGS